MMKRFHSILCCLIIAVLCLSGCGGTNNTSNSESYIVASNDELRFEECSGGVKLVAYKELSSVADECRNCKISKLWSDRLVPIGNGESMSNLEISKDIMPDYINELKKAQGDSLTNALYPKTQVAMERALQFIDSDGPIYSCSAGNSFLTVDEFGQVMPCRRMPIICGNIFESTLEDIYYNNEIFKQLRLKTIPQECIKCKYAFDCRGGAKCQSFAKYSDFNRADPSCPFI